jgi:chromosome segregation ATPase
MAERRQSPRTAGDEDIASQISKLTSNVTSLTNKFNDFKKEINKSLSGVIESNQTLKKSIDEAVLNFQSSIEQTQGEIVYLKNKCNALNERVIYLEGQSRRDNLLLDGVPEVTGTTREDEDACLRKVYNVFEQKLLIPNARQVQISRCDRVGSNTGISQLNHH